jgi:peptidoglycan hydrolase-like protein with peptidoglycan-binding domain
LSNADIIITRMNAMTPRSQALLIWDIEGWEYDGFVFVGHPSTLPLLSPQMNAVADEMFAKFRNAGYKIGVTLRPNKFGTGTTPPPACKFDSNPLGTVNDVFIKSNAPVGQKIMSCTASGTYAVVPWAYPQTTDSADEAYNILSSEITYAKKRWGMNIFYVDSTVFTSGGHVLDFQVFRRLQQAFPDALLLPENEDDGDYGAAAPYNDIRINPMDTPDLPKLLYPQAFQAIEVSSGNLTDPRVHDVLVQSLKNGNMFFVDAWWDNPSNAQVLQMYREAAGSCLPIFSTLARGSRRTEVAVLQSYLVSQNLLTPDSATGYYGALTEAAVQKLQSQKGIVSSGSPAATGFGVVGEQTRAALHACGSPIRPPQARPR